MYPFPPPVPHNLPPPTGRVETELNDALILNAEKHTKTLKLPQKMPPMEMTCALLAPLARRDDIIFVACILTPVRRSSEAEKCENRGPKKR